MSSRHAPLRVIAFFLLLLLGTFMVSAAGQAQPTSHRTSPAQAFANGTEITFPPNCTSSFSSFFNYPGPPIPINDGNPPQLITATIPVALPGIIYGVQANLGISHTYNSDLDITLTSPEGTIVTLTSDNGGEFDNVFQLTSFVDWADAGGALPYEENFKLVTDNTYANHQFNPILVPEEPLSAFYGENPTGNWLLTISDDTNQDGGSLNRVSLLFATTTVAPVGVNHFENNFLPVPIPSGPALISNTITINNAPDGVILDLNVTTSITHTNNEDLDITLTGPNGRIVTLTTDNGEDANNVFAGTLWDDQADPGGPLPYSSNPFLVADANYQDGVTQSPLAPEEGLNTFIGEEPEGTWTLTVSDDSAENSGQLNGFGLELVLGDCPTPVVTYCSDFAPIAIPDGTGTFVGGTLTIPDDAPILDANLRISATHSYVGDLIFRLSDNDSSAVVVDRPDGGNCTGNNIAGSYVDDEGTDGNWENACTGSTPAYPPNSRLVGGDPPSTVMSFFESDSTADTWLLEVSDNAAVDTGTLDGFCLEFKIPNPQPTPTNTAVPPTLTPTPTVTRTPTAGPSPTPTATAEPSSTATTTPLPTTTPTTGIAMSKLYLPLIRRD